MNDGIIALKYNLQFFAKEGPGGEKTEEPTSKRLSDARSEGQVAKSMELNSAIALIAMFLVLRNWGGNMGSRFLENFSWIYSSIPDRVVLTNGVLPEQEFAVLIRLVLIRMLIILLPIFAIGVAVAFITNVLQVKWSPTTKPLQPKFSKLNPASGVKRLFSMEKLFELAKSVAKIVLIFLVVRSYLKDRIGIIFLIRDYSVMNAVALVTTTVVDMGFRISLVYLLIGIADYIYQKHKFHEDMKMTKQEVKDEYKNSEGDPQIKGKIRQKMQEASRRRMMQAIPKADVVITNPTHYAVALQYDASVSIAPVVVAKGQDFLAAKIKEIAKESGVEIVENKPLARMLYANVDIGELVPPELYQAVADVLAFVYTLKNKDAEALG